MADVRFTMTTDQLLDGIREQVFIARRSKGKSRKEAFSRLLDYTSTARDLIVLGFPEPRGSGARDTPNGGAETSVH